MWKPNKIIVKGLLSYKDVEYDFEVGDLSVFFGRNMSKDGANSNGSGKSTLIEAITVAYTGKVYRKINKSHFVNNESKFCEVDWYLHNNITDEKLHIYRKIYKGSTPAKVNVKINGVEVKDVLDYNKWIYNKIGVSEKDFLNYYVIGQDNRNSFLAATDAKQKEVISRFSDDGLIDEVVVGIDEEISGYQRENDELHDAVLSIDSKLEVYQEEMQDVDEVEEDDGVNDIVDSVRGKIKKLKKKIKNTKDVYSVDEHKSLSSKYAELTELIGDIENSVHKSNRTLRKLEVAAAGQLECPNCHEKFIPESEYTIKELSSKIDNLNAEIAKSKSKIKTKNKKAGKLDELVCALDELKRDMDMNQHKLKRLQKELVEIEELISNKVIIKTDKVKVKKKIKQLEANKLNTSVQIEKVMNEQNKLIDIKTHFNRNNFRSYIANIFIQNIEGKANFFLDKFNTGLTLKIEGFTKLANGEYRDKISVSVVDNGVMKPYYAYSGGERSRVDLCTIITLHDFMNNACDYGKGLDLLVLDEWTSSLDINGVNDILRILKVSGITSVIVMQQIENIAIENKVFFTKTKTKGTVISNE